MAEDTKKNQSKSRNDPKEQRRKRQNRHPAASTDKKIEKGPEATKVPVIEKSAPPVYEPPPEFYKNLKRETDEILKITEEENAKYKKKEIQSNWAKYEMPIETYEEIDEQENLGADYQALIDASLSVGGHFQFKHEKSWDANTGPSPYDKYFDANMESLNLALCSIPFYERNNIDTCIFNETEIQTMTHRSIKYKQKYFNDKKYTTPELDAQDKILNSITKSDENVTTGLPKEDDNNIEDLQDRMTDIDLSEKETKVEETTESLKDYSESHLDIISISQTEKEIETKKNHKNKEDIIVNKDKADKVAVKVDTVVVKDTVDNVIDNKCTSNKLNPEVCVSKDETSRTVSFEESEVKSNIVENNKAKKSEPVKEQAKNPVIESPEDLEKWLDDFLDE